MSATLYRGEDDARGTSIEVERYPGGEGYADDKAGINVTLQGEVWGDDQVTVGVPDSGRLPLARAIAPEGYVVVNERDLVVLERDLILAAGTDTPHARRVSDIVRQAKGLAR